ncbi:MAG: hypothetical protein JWM98_2841 [Thermoleophilia bacterium]|nr:hypothetical protein [Thermoleophilia bacterium]
MRVAGLVYEAGPTAVGRASNGATITTPSGRAARVLADPALPRSRPDAQWTVPAGATLFGSSGVPDIGDITQGDLGDCWFVAHAGALAYTDPTALRAMFEETPDYYVVHFAQDSVAVSKRLAFHDGVPAFAAHVWTAASGRGLWTAVLEKAAAARDPRGYAGLVGGQAHDAFQLSLGTIAQRVTWSPGSANTPFDDALRGVQLGLPTAVGTAPFRSIPRPGLPRIAMSLGQRQVLEGAGISGNHYYVVLGTGTRDGEQTIRLYNPRTASQPTRDLTRDEFNAVMTDSDTPDRYGDYMRSGLAQAAQRLLGLDPDTPGWPTAGIQPRPL